jgi:hypothetical protein
MASRGSLRAEARRSAGSVIARVLPALVATLESRGLDAARDFGARLARYFRFADDSAEVWFLERGDEVVIGGRPTRGRVPAESEDAFCVFIERLIADLSQSVCRPLAISMTRAQPADGGERHARTLGCPVSFSHDKVEIRYARAQADSRAVARSWQRSTTASSSTISRSSIDRTSSRVCAPSSSKCCPRGA